MPEEKTLKEKASYLENHLPCNCNLDSWQPEPSTGHSWVCRIHKIAIGRSIDLHDLARRWHVPIDIAELKLVNIRKEYNRFCEGK